MDTSDFGDSNYSQMAQAYHLRPQKPKIMSKVYYSHTNKLGLVKLGFVPAATIALQKVGNQFHYGVTICSKYDNFSKKYGRETAEKRLHELFGVMEIPEPLKDLPEKQQCLQQLYNLAASVTLKQRKWKKRITAFNKQAKVVTLEK